MSKESCLLSITQGPAIRKKQAASLGGNAVIAVDLDYETIGSTGTNMLMVSASGTAVVFEE